MTEDILMRQYEYVYHKNERLMPKKLFVSNLRANRLCLGGYGELYLIDLEKIVYFQADDHYTHVYYTAGVHFLLPFGLARVEEAVKASAIGMGRLLRVGRKYMVNISRIFHISVIKQQLVMSDGAAGSIALKVPKATLRELVNKLNGACHVAADEAVDMPSVPLS